MTTYFLEIDGFFFTVKRTFINHYLLAVSRQKSRSLTKVNMKKQIRAPTINIVKQFSYFPLLNKSNEEILVYNLIN